MKKVFSLFLIFTCSALTLFADEQLVQEKLDMVLKELEDPRSFNWELPDFIINFFKFLGEIGLLYRILFYLFIIALVVFILYKIISLFIKDSSSVLKKKKEKLSGIQNCNTGRNHFLLKAGALSKSGDYSQALVQLHNGSYEYLFYKKLLQKGRDYTNREIFRMLKGDESLKAFKEIALEAELTVFRGVRIDEKRYKQLETLFREAFYVQD